MNDSAELFGDPSWYDIENPSPTTQRFRNALLKESRQVDRRHPEEAQPPPSAAEANGAAPAPGRTANGRFAKGNRCGTGNPFARQVAGLRKALLNAVTEEDMQRLARKLLEQALEGSTAAAKLLLTYVLGKPTEMPDPDRLNLDDYRILIERFGPLREDWDKIRECTPVEGIIEAGHLVADLRARNWREQVLEPETEAERERRRERKAQRFAREEEAIARAVQEAKDEILGMYAREQERYEQEAREAGRVAGLSAAEAARMAQAATQAEYPTRKPPSPNGGNGSGNGSGSGAAPSPNGGNGPASPRPGGFAAFAQTLFRPGWKARYGRKEGPPPSANGGNGAPPPSANGG